MTKPGTFLANAQTLREVKDRFLDGDPLWQHHVPQLIQAADAKLLVPPQIVVHKKLPLPSGDPHDYVSLHPYWWPNPKTSDGLPYVLRDGEVNPERFEYDVVPLESMTQAVRPLTFAYFFTGDKRYAEHATRLLRAWFIDPATRMNPNLEFAQFVPGRPTKNDDGHGTIETVRFRWLIDGIGLLATSQAWSEEDTVSIQAWFRQYVHWLRTSTKGKNISQLSDNKGSWYDTQVGLYSLFIGDTPTATAHITSAQQRIGRQIEPDGRQPAELRRTRSLHYSMYALQALFDAAILGRHMGLDLFSFVTSDGRSLRQALDFLIPYTVDKQSWPYQQIDELRWYIMAELLRRAAVYYREPAYERYLQQLPHAFTRGLDTSSIGSWFDLIGPPLAQRQQQEKIARG